MNQKGFAYIIALIAIIILLGGIGAYVVLDRQAQPTPVSSPVSEPPTPGPITKGDKVIAPLVKVSKVSVPDDYVIFRLLLSDGRKLLVSGAHPTADSRAVEELRNQDSLDGARIVEKDLVPYGDLFTYDILPASDTGLYWANDILLKSTLVE